MKKKIFGIKIGTILSVLCSLAAAVLFWLVVRYTEATSAEALRVSFTDLVRWI